MSPELLSERVNRLLVRGGRLLDARARPGSAPVPFPANMVGAVTARAAVIALLKLLVPSRP